MEKWQELYNKAKKGGFRMLEYLSRSEGPELFTQALNDKLIRAANPELPDSWNLIYDEINMTEGRSISFPSVRGVNPDLVPEMAEFKSVQHEFTSITVEPQKFGMRIPFSREMAEDNQVGLLGWRTEQVGRAHRELKRREAFKAISFFSTGPAVSTGVVGIRNHGIFYPTGGYSNFISATAASWEERIARGINALMTQTITVGDMVINFPVRPDFILANPTHQHSIQKVLNASITVVATGVGPGGAAAGAANNVAGTNIFVGILPIQIFDPTIPTAQAFIGKAKQGLVMVNRTPLEVEAFENIPFDVDDIKTRERFLPAVIEDRFICDIQITA